MKFSHFRNSGSLMAAGLVILLGTMVGPVAAQAAAYLGPETMVAAKDGKSLYVAQLDAKQVVVVDLAGGRVVRAIGVPAAPTGMALSPDGATLYVTCAAPKSTICAIDVVAGRVSYTLPAGHTASGLAITPDGKRLYVCNRFNDNVSVIDLQTKHELVRVPVIREPVAAAITPDGKTVFVANLLPADRSDGANVAASLTAIDTATNKPVTIRLPNGSSSVHGVCVSPDGKYVYVSHILSRYQMPTTQLDRGWMNTNALTIIDAPQRKWINTVLLDNVDLGAANPWGVATTADGNTVCVAQAGTHELSAIDVPAMMAKLAALTSGETPKDSVTASSLTPADVPNDLAFLVGLRRRISLPGVGPRGVVMVGSTAYAAEYFSDTLSVVDLATAVENTPASRVRQIALGPKPELTPQRRGEMLFFDARICFQHWQSCGSCHPDARVDGLNWDLMNDGLGNPKNTKSMLLAHQTPPAMWEAVRGDADEAVRAGITHILFAVRPEEEIAAINDYLKSLEPVPSPHLVDGKLSAAAERGKKLFFDSSIGCGTCHSEPLYTDMRLHNVNSRGQYDRREEFNTPTLVEVWRTAPYLHDGQYATIKELLGEGKHGDTAGRVDKLTPQQIDDLVEFVRSL